MPSTVTLHCQAGNHSWERPSQRGRKPLSCPEHTVMTTSCRQPAAPVVVEPEVQVDWAVEERKLTSQLDEANSRWETAMQMANDSTPQEMARAYDKADTEQQKVIRIAHRLRHAQQHLVAA